MNNFILLIKKARWNGKFFSEKETEETRKKLRELTSGDDDYLKKNLVNLPLDSFDNSFWFILERLDNLNRDCKGKKTRGSEIYFWNTFRDIIWVLYKQYGSKK